MPDNIKVVLENKLGRVNKDKENILAIYLKASPIFSALKKIQANVTKPKVKLIFRKSFIEGRSFPLATDSRLLRFLFNSNRSNHSG